MRVLWNTYYCEHVAVTWNMHTLFRIYIVWKAMLLWIYIVLNATYVTMNIRCFECKWGTLLWIHVAVNTNLLRIWNCVTQYCYIRCFETVFVWKQHDVFTIVRCLKYVFTILRCLKYVSVVFRTMRKWSHTVSVSSGCNFLQGSDLRVAPQKSEPWRKLHPDDT